MVKDFLTDGVMTLSEAVILSYDHGDYPDIFPVDYGMDLKLYTVPDLKIKIWNPRVARIEVTSFIGVSAGAIHYYSKIVADGVSLYRDTSKGRIIVGGYVCEEFSKICKDSKGKYDPVYQIDVLRQVTESEIRQDPIRWHGYSQGDITNAFCTEESAIEQALSVAKLRFSEGWVIQLG